MFITNLEFYFLKCNIETGNFSTPKLNFTEDYMKIILLGDHLNVWG